MIKYINRLDILVYLEKCSNTMDKKELQREICKLKNLVEDQCTSELRKILGS